jgi:hypothetical protein
MDVVAGVEEVRIGHDSNTFPFQNCRGCTHEVERRIVCTVDTRGLDFGFFGKW